MTFNLLEPETIWPVINGRREIPLFTSFVTAGFPSPADDYLDKNIDLNEYLIANQSSTFLVRVKGDSMQGCGILDGDILVVDRSLEPAHNRVIVGIIDGEFTVKRFVRENGKAWLKPENPAYSSIEITPERDFTAWGVVTFAIHDL